MSVQILTGNCLEVLPTIPSESVQCCVTSPPYYRLRKYGNDSRELGQEKTPEEFVLNLVTVFEQVRRVLKNDGIIWIVIGDSYAHAGHNRSAEAAVKGSTLNGSKDSQGIQIEQGSKLSGNLKTLDLIGIPWMLAFALRNAGWYLRSEVIWHKKNCMPESVGRKKNKWTFKNGRPTRSHETVFLLQKSRECYYDSEAIAEPCIWDVDGTGTASRKARAHERTKSFPTTERNGMRGGGFKDSSKMNGKNGDKQRGHSRRHAGFNDRWDAMSKEQQCAGRRNKRDVWAVAPSQYHDAHFATFPPALILPMIRAGSRRGDTVIDPFGGSGTVGQVCEENGRNSILIDLYAKHEVMAKNRLEKITSGLGI
jgi:DNA modification methylase